jgi:hypothetical protein
LFAICVWGTVCAGFPAIIHLLAGMVAARIAYIRSAVCQISRQHSRPLRPETEPRIETCRSRSAGVDFLTRAWRSGFTGCVASTVFGHFQDLVKMPEGPPIGHLSKP